ncbi:MAG: EamA family transporter [Candidatus Melainabacteria bacterium]|nr:MAG: EamA family transporter [Candidatus Melainabacteria bacterium]
MPDKLPKQFAYLALAAAFLFGASTPACKVLLTHIHPAMLAGLLYLGSGIGLGTFSILKRFFVKQPTNEAGLSRTELPWLAGAIVFGGIAAPLFLMYGLRASSASSASLLLNLEAAFTALIAWFVFRENVDRRVFLGMCAIVCGGLCLAYQPGESLSLSSSALPIVAACLCWAADNNLTRKVSGADPLISAGLKGFVAGVVNCFIALKIGDGIPETSVLIAACLVGLFSYGLSLSLYIRSLRHLGTARTSAYFSTAPFIGAALAIAFLNEPLSLTFTLAGVLMAAGVWLHVTEQHSHEHTHEAIEHEHQHVHDEHHQHEHDSSVPVDQPHTHRHRHERITHSHHHYPDLHHDHEH